VANAFEHGAEASPIDVTVTGDAKHLRLSVKNEGEPIPADLIPQLFQPYFRAGHTAPSRGLGLGLYIASEIARSHGGTLRVTSTKAAGTTFAFQMPRLPPS
ncbi:MAG: sensor histidine kinase, partial [Myxococcaceae bacterium]